MKVEPWGESGWLISDLPYSSASLLRGLRSQGVTAWAGPDSVCLLEIDSETEVKRLVLEVSPDDYLPRRFEIPVLYDGPDLRTVAELTDLSVSEVILLHTSRDYLALSMGFCPGFAYLGPLPPPLDTAPRLDSPRSRVEAGSVALAAGMTAVYPLVKPGGWRLIGRTPLVMVDQEAGFYPIEAGDIVRFCQCSETEFMSDVGHRLEPAQ